MALAQSMKVFVDDLKASRRSRHEFVKGNREITKNIMAENRKFLQNIHAQNQANAQQTHAFLKSAKETREQSFKQLMDGIKADLLRIHQGKEAIIQGAREMLKEFRADNQLAHQYWQSVATDMPIEEPKAEKKVKAEESKKNPVQANVPSGEVFAQKKDTPKAEPTLEKKAVPKSEPKEEKKG